MSETTKTHHVSGLATKLRIAGNIDLAPVTDGLVKVMMAGARCPGFWSAEIIPPSVNRGEWTLLERFSSGEQALAWMHSEQRKQLLEALRAIAPGRLLTVDELLDEHGSTGTAATAIVTNVKTGMEAAYWEFEARIQSAQARFPGYRGTYIQPPPQDRPGQWTTLLRFDTPETLEAWLASQERKSLLSEGRHLINDIDFQDMSSSFPGWFPADKSGQRPPVWKTACLVFVGIFPIVVALKAFLWSQLSGLSSALALAIVTALSVSGISWVCMPILVRLFRWWLLPNDPDKRSRITATGAALILVLFLLELLLFWGF